MPTQSAQLKRCATCERWSGNRQTGIQPGTVEIPDEKAVGLCQGGPWNGTERRARSGCGHWTPWPAIALPVDGA